MPPRLLPDTFVPPARPRAVVTLVELSLLSERGPRALELIARGPSNTQIVEEAGLAASC